MTMLPFLVILLAVDAKKNKLRIANIFTLGLNAYCLKIHLTLLIEVECKASI